MAATLRALAVNTLPTLALHDLVFHSFFPAPTSNSRRRSAKSGQTRSIRSILQYYGDETPRSDGRISPRALLLRQPSSCDFDQVSCMPLAIPSKRAPIVNHNAASHFPRTSAFADVSYVFWQLRPYFSAEAAHARRKFFLPQSSLRICMDYLPSAMVLSNASPATCNMKIGFRYVVEHLCLALTVTHRAKMLDRHEE